MTRGADTKAAELRPTGEPRIHRVLSHPVRYAVWTALGDRQYTKVELAEGLDEDSKRVSEALTFLLKEKFIEVVAEPSGENGGRIPIYRARRHVFDADDWAALPAIAREDASYLIFRLIATEISGALADRSFDSHPHRTLIRRPLWLDDEGVAEADAILTEADKRLVEAELRSAERLAVSGETPQRFLEALIAAPAAAADRLPENSG